MGTVYVLYDWLITSRETVLLNCLVSDTNSSSANHIAYSRKNVAGYYQEHIFF